MTDKTLIEKIKAARRDIANLYGIDGEGALNTCLEIIRQHEAQAKVSLAKCSEALEVWLLPGERLDATKAVLQAANVPYSEDA